MSLRLRLSVLYTSLAGGVLLVFGTLVYGIVSLILLGQIDNRLDQAAIQLVERLRVNAASQFDPRAVANYQPTENLVFQVWDTQRNLQFSRPAGLVEPLDEGGIRIGQSFYTSKTINGISVRVLSVPLKTNRGPVGYLQIGSSMALVDITQRALSNVLVVLTALIMIVVGVSTWVLTGDALRPLEAVTQLATQITQADDLSRRIPFSGSAKDEMGQLIVAFNDTLERLESLFNTQRRFLADVSHELRTPLTVIKGEVGLMRLTGGIDDESLHNIELEVDRLTRMVGDLLLLAQAESGRLPLELVPIELDTVLLEAFQQIQTLAGGKLTLHLDEIDQLVVNGDRDRLKQVILNLLANAVEYTPQGGDVRVALRKAGMEAQLVVQDTGPGIPAEDLPFIFERFYRAERSRKRNTGGGFGLGLSIVHWLVRKHDGRIEVKSETGKGTRFTVWLPLAK